METLETLSRTEGAVGAIRGACARMRGVMFFAACTTLPEGHRWRAEGKDGAVLIVGLLAWLIWTALCLVWFVVLPAAVVIAALIVGGRAVGRHVLCKYEIRRVDEKGVSGE